MARPAAIACTRDRQHRRASAAAPARRGPRASAARWPRAPPGRPRARVSRQVAGARACARSSATTSASAATSAAAVRGTWRGAPRPRGAAARAARRPGSRRAAPRRAGSHVRVRPGRRARGGAPSSRLASSSRPRLMRLFTVPSGTPQDLRGLFVGQALEVAQDERLAQVGGQRAQAAVHDSTRSSRSRPRSGPVLAGEAITSRTRGIRRSGASAPRAGAGSCRWRGCARRW